METNLKWDDDDLNCVGMQTKVRASMALFKNLAHMLQQQQFCDLVFELTGSIKFHTHRLVFALWSPVMMNLLNQSSCRVEKVLVKCSLQDAFKQFIHFLYTGTFEGNITDIDGVLLLASTFQIPLLKNLCEKQLQQSVTVENVIGLFHISVRYQLSYLEKQCVEHIRDHLPEVAQQTELKDLNPEQFNTFLASQHVSQLNPEMKLFLIISWLTEQVNDRQHFLVLLLRHIDWSTVAQDFLTEISQTENFFTSHPSSLYLLLQTLHSASISLGPYADRFEALRREHNEILNNVVASSVHMGTGRQEIFQPVQLILMSGLEQEKEKVPSPSKKPEVVSKSGNSKTKTSKSKAEPLMNEDKSIKNKKNLAVRNLGENEKRVNSTLTRKNLKGKASLSKSKRDPLPSKNGDKTSPTASTISRNSRRTTNEGGSMRRKTLRPRKIVPNQSIVSIVSSPTSSNRTVSTRRSAALQKAEKESNVETESQSKSASVVGEGVNKQNDDVRSKEKDNSNNPPGTNFEDDEDDDNDFGDGDDNDDDYVEAATTKQLKRRHSKLVLGKAKIGRPRKGFERNKFSCPQCEYVTRQSYVLDKHIRQVHESKRIIKCPICDLQFSWSKKLYIHMRTDHFANAGPPFLCDIPDCNYISDKMNKLVEHRRSHTDDRPFMCDECKMSFKSKSNLYAHFKCHSDVRDHECHICHQRFKMKITLEQHLVVHDETKPYSCDLCDFSTKYQTHLNAHKRKHSGDVFPCTFPSCTYSTPKKSTLQAHMRSHLGIRQHVCETCNKAFIEKSHLVRHRRIHTSEKQHKCPQCDYASHRRDKLREHMQKHERDATRGNKKDNTSEEKNDNDNDGGGAASGAGVSGNSEGSTEPKKRKRRKKVREEMTQTQQRSPKTEDSSSISSRKKRKVEPSTTTSTVISLNTPSPTVPSSAPQVTILRNDSSGAGSNNNISHTEMPSPELQTGNGGPTVLSTVVPSGSIIIEAGTHFEHIVSNSRKNDNNTNPNTNIATVVHLPPPKQEGDWSDMELLTRMGFTAATADGHSLNIQPAPSSSSSSNPTHVVRTIPVINRDSEENISVGMSSSVSSSISMNNNNGNGNSLTEFTEIFRGFEALSPPSTSVVVAATAGSGSGSNHHHHPLHPSIPQPPHIHLPPGFQSGRVNVISSDGGGGGSSNSNNFPGPPPSSRSVMLASFPPQGELDTSTHQQQQTRGVKPNDNEPHPIIMIPNMSSPSISSPPQTYLHHHHHPQPHQHHHHHHPHQNLHQHQHADDDQRHYHNHHHNPHHHQHHQQQQRQQHHPSPSSSSSSLSQQQHQQMRQQQQQQQSNQNNQSSSPYQQYTGYPY